MRELFERIVQILLDFKTKITNIEKKCFQIDPNYASGPVKFYRFYNNDGDSCYIPNIVDSETNLVLDRHLPDATTETKGVMSPEDKTKLDAINPYGVCGSRASSVARMQAGSTEMTTPFGTRELVYGYILENPLIINVYGMYVDDLGKTHVIPLDWYARVTEGTATDGTPYATYSVYAKLKEPLTYELTVYLFSNYKFGYGM